MGRRLQVSAVSGKVAVGVALVIGGIATALTAWAVGMPVEEAAELAAIASGTALVVGLLGAGLLLSLRRRRLGTQITVVALTGVGAVGAGAATAAKEMFLTSHDLSALIVILVVAGAVGIASSLALGARVAEASRSLERAARRIGTGERVANIGGPPAGELSGLAQRLEETSAQLQQTRAHEAALDASRRELVAWVSHDLRTPLAGIRAMAEALEDRVADDPETVTRYQHGIRVEADRLAGLVDDLFELSRINAGTLGLQLERVSLADVVSDAIAGASGIARTKGVRLEGRMANACELELSTPEIARALRNVLENAIRHTPCDGAVWVEADADDRHAYVSIVDACGGIPDCDIERVFDVAFRGETARTKKDDGGAGIGLAIARGIVEAHKGEIAVQPEPGVPVHDSAAAVPVPAGRRVAVKVLVTGGAGFVGSHVVDALVDEGAEVLSIDALHSAAHRGEPDYLNPQADYAWVDLRDETPLRALVSGVDAVCHQASMVGLEASFADVSDYVGHNDLGTARLLSALYATSFRGPLVLASSMVVYGEGAYRCDVHGEVRPGPRDPERLACRQFDPGCPECGKPPTPVAITEDAASDPRSIYAATKLNQEHLCAFFMRETGAPLTTLRYHNVYGSRMPRDSSYSGVAAIFRSALEGGLAPQVFEDGRQMRDFVHVSDVARANVMAIFADQPVAGTFNISSGTPRTVYEIAEALAAAFRAGAPAPQITGASRPGDVRHVMGSPQRAAQVLGWRAEIDVEIGMNEFATDPLREIPDRPTVRPGVIRGPRRPQPFAERRASVSFTRGPVRKIAPE